MKNPRHTLISAVLAALVAVWLHMCAQTECRCKHAGAGEAPAAVLCVCVCHTAFGIPPAFEPCGAPETEGTSFDYVPPHGTSVPGDIFRPPLANA
jgi:hypothetical protein